MGQRIAFPKPVAKIMEAIAELQQQYPGRNFPLDGMLFGDIGEVIAAEAFELPLLKQSLKSHDVGSKVLGMHSVKIVGAHRNSVAFRSECDQLIVMQMINAHEAEVVYRGPGKPVWDRRGKQASNGQSSVRMSVLREEAQKLGQG